MCLLLREITANMSRSGFTAALFILTLFTSR